MVGILIKAVGNNLVANVAEVIIAKLVYVTAKVSRAYVANVICGIFIKVRKSFTEFLVAELASWQT